MERRIVGVVRWLERCLKAFRAGGLESALMDAECARAELEHLRKDLWAAIERKKLNGDSARAGAAGCPLRAASVAVVIVLLTATPLLRPEEQRAVRPEPTASLEWVTPDEKALLGNLRRYLSDSNPFASIPPERDGALATTEPETRKPQATGKIAERPVEAEKRNDEGEGIPYDRIASLVRAGERALKNERSIITIERGQGVNE
ncbi:MAG: hypothetical protein LBQ90_06190 [Synergistaceae bacterium]|jgi:hypothetical protein|nr:hypothetical protein [Synergistaceae bacterium]